MKKLIVSIMAIVFLVSCAGWGLNPANLKDDHARGNFVNKTFLMALADYSYYAKLPNLTDEAKVLLRAKREILVQMLDPFYGPVVLFNRAVVGGELITEEGWMAMLDKLLTLETGWYTGSSKAETIQMYTGEAAPQTFNLDKVKNPDSLIVQAGQQASIIKSEYRTQAIWEGLLFELIRTGIHAIRALLAQKGMDEAQLAAAWAESWAQIQAITPESIVVVQ